MDVISLCSYVTDGDAHVYLHAGVDICRVVQRHISKVRSVECVQSVSSGPRTDPLRDTASTTDRHMQFAVYDLSGTSRSIPVRRP